MSVCRPMSRRSFVRLAALSALGILALGSLSGCSPTEIDVYVPTSITVRSSDGAVLSATTITLDERGNAVSTRVETPAGTQDSVAEFDTYGAPASSEGITREVTYDDKGQPTAIVERASDGTEVATWHYTYYDVQGRVLEATYQGIDYGYDVVFGRDGWPLSGEVSVDDARHYVHFVYEVDLNGTVTRQNISFDDAEKPELWYTYTYETHDETSLVATATASDGTATSYEYTLVENPTPYAMALALLHAPDYATLVDMVKS